MTKRHEEGMSPEKIIDSFGAGYLFDLLDRHGREQQVFEEINWVYKESVLRAQECGEEAVGCVPASLILALGPGRILPSEIHSLADEEYLSERAPVLLETDKLDIRIPYSSHQFRTMMEEIDTQGAIIGTNGDSHLIGTGIHLIFNRKTEEVIRAYDVLDLRLKEDPCQIFFSDELPELYAQADINEETGIREILVLKRPGFSSDI